MNLQGRTRLKIWLVILGVFALGCVTGASLDGLYRLKSGHEREARRGGRDKEARFEEMRRDLDLNEEQATQIRAILDETRNEIRALRTEVQPRYETINKKARERMRALLNPEQQQRFDQKIAERDAKRSKREEKGGRTNEP
jgi:Spy/CpxP family protein refolding chaperone